jgi:hypothetical protein
VPAQTGAPAPRGFDAPSALLRLVVGGTVEGATLLIERLRVWEAQAITRLRASEPAVAAPVEDRLRYALIGLLFVLEHQASIRASALIQTTMQQPGELARVLNHLTTVPVVRLLAKPVKQALDSTNHSLEDELERWIRIGRLEERQGRAIARIATSELVDEVLNQLSDNPALTDLMQQQSVGLAGSVIRDVRQTATSADDRIEQMARRLLRSPTHNTPPNPGAPNDGAKADTV